MEDQEMKLLHEFEEDKKWFFENEEKLREKKLTGKFVAVSGGNVVSSHEKMEGVIKSLEKEGFDPSITFVEFVHPKGFTLLL